MCRMDLDKTITFKSTVERFIEEISFFSSDRLPKMIRFYVSSAELPSNTYCFVRTHHCHSYVSELSWVRITEIVAGAFPLATWTTDSRDIPEFKELKTSGFTRNEDWLLLKNWLFSLGLFLMCLQHLFIEQPFQRNAAGRLIDINNESLKQSKRTKSVKKTLMYHQQRYSLLFQWLSNMYFWSAGSEHLTHSMLSALGVIASFEQ